jgi:hypothetical protein
MKRTILVLAALFAPAQAQDLSDVFSDAPGDAKLHIASGFVCPLQIAEFERDAAGQKDPSAGADYCAYSSLDGVYGTITLTPLPMTYDPKAMLAPDFAVQEGSGGTVVGETIETLGSKSAPLPVFIRTYETAKLAAMHYETQFASAAVGAWVVEVEIEYAAPRDKDLRTNFLNTAFALAQDKIASLPQ